jgi:hypothetical protein
MPESRSTRLSPEVDALLVHMAKAKGQSIAQEIREAVEWHVGWRKRVAQILVPEDGPEGIVPLTSDDVVKGDVVSKDPLPTLDTSDSPARRPPKPSRVSPDVRRNEPREPVGMRQLGYEQPPDSAPRGVSFSPASRCSCPASVPAEGTRCSACGRVR